MDLAKKIQTVLLPPNQRLKNYEIAAIMNPAESVGGDYYDVVPSADRPLGVRSAMFRVTG
jgi:serine phosphatase RsbU (regulator of sigma subunit)